MRSTWKYDFLLLAVVVVWGLNFPVIKVALEAMHPFSVNAYRFALSAGVLGGMHWAESRRRRTAFWGPLRARPWALVGIGVLGYVLYQMLFILGINATTAGSAALIMASAPMWTALGARALGEERLPLLGWGGLALSLAGTVVVVLSGGKAVELGGSALLGNVLMLGAAAAWAAYTVLSRPILRTMPATALTFFGILIALPAIFGLAFFGGVDWSLVNVPVWLAIAFSGALSTGAAVAWWNRGVQAVGASQAAAFSNLVPVVALLTAAAVGEPVTTVQLVGGALIIGGLLTLRRARTTVALPPALPVTPR